MFVCMFVCMYECMYVCMYLYYVKKTNKMFPAIKSSKIRLKRALNWLNSLVCSNVIRGQIQNHIVVKLHVLSAIESVFIKLFFQY